VAVIDAQTREVLPLRQVIQLVQRLPGAVLTGFSAWAGVMITRALV